MSRIRVSSDGDCVVIRQGSSVIVIGYEQAETVAAAIEVEVDKISGRSESGAVKAFDTAVRSFHSVYVPPVGAGL